jgi:hypothetical protein
MENATEVMPQRMWSWVKEMSSLSARMSNNLQEASSEPVAKASPLGKNLRQGELRRRTKRCRDSLYSVYVRFMSDKGLCGLATSDIPQLGGSVAGTGDEDVLVRAERQAISMIRNGVLYIAGTRTS